MPDDSPSTSTRPFLSLYVVWHPNFGLGPTIAEAIRQHFRRQLYENVAGGAGLSVLFRFAAGPSSSTPLPIDLGSSETTAIVVLADDNLAADVDWLAWIHGLAEEAHQSGLAARVFPVSIESSVLQPLGVAEQALRWDLWQGTSEMRSKRLTAELAYEFCRMLRHYLEHLQHPSEDEQALEKYLKKVQVFISHSKHDQSGTKIATQLRERLYESHGLASFFDVYDIPAGLRFNQVIVQQVKTSAVVAIHTDSYSSREWCRREIIEAKLAQVPLVVANAISDLDERGFPYMGNVPLVRIGVEGDRLEFVISRLLDEVLKDFLWRCRVALAGSSAGAEVIFLPRPPELIALAKLPSQHEVPTPILVYPDPPIGAEEERLFSKIAPRVQLRSFTEWIAGAIR